MDFPRPRTAGSARPRRVFTAPVPPSAPQPAASPQSAGGLVDTLYDHPNVKIVSFTAGSRPFAMSPRAAAGPDIEPGSLPWSTQLERTIAVGPFRIYRAPGSVAFLSCGTALQPILPKSQVWCVDEESSKFVLQIRRPQYWRIEVPVGEEEELRLARQLRVVFDAILQFEKTECPFQRSFTVELPPRPQTPVKKRPWTPARRSSASLPLRPATAVEVARLHEGTPRGSICMGDLRSVLDARRALNEHARSLEPPAEEPLSPQGAAGPDAGDVPRPSPSLVERARSKFAAPQLHVTPTASPRPKPRAFRSASTSTYRAKFESPSESLESLRGRESWLSPPLPPSPPLSSPGSPRNSSAQLHTLKEPETADAGEDVLSRAVVPKPSQTWSVATADSAAESESSSATAPSSVHDEPCSTVCSPPSKAHAPAPTPILVTEACEPTPQANSPSPALSASPGALSTPVRRRPIRRATTSSSISSRRALSPLPPAAELLTRTAQSTTSSTHNPSSPTPAAAANTTLSQTPRTTTGTGSPAAPGAGPLAAVRRLPMTVLAKTCEILMSPPSHLISLMLNVAARITAGEWRGSVFGTGEGGERVSVAWDWSDEDEELLRDQARERERERERDLGVALASGSGWRGWASGSGSGSGLDTRGGRGGNNDDDLWLRGRGRMKMAGAFPESDDDEDDYDDAVSDERQEEEEEEEELGPLEQPRRSISPGQKRGADGSPGNRESSTALGDGLDGTGERARAGPEWGID